MELTVEQRHDLHTVICSAFNESELVQVVRLRLGDVLQHLVQRGSFEQVVFELIDVYERKGEIGKLIEALRAERPNNPHFQALIDRYGQGQAPSPGVPPAPPTVPPSFRSLIWFLLGLAVIAVFVGALLFGSAFQRTPTTEQAKPDSSPSARTIDGGGKPSTDTKDGGVGLERSRSALAQKNMEETQRTAEASKKAYEETKWVSEEGKQLAGDAANDFNTAVTASHRGEKEMALHQYPAAESRFQEAQTKFEAARAKYADAASRIEPERFVNLYAYVKTAGDNKECGGWRIRVLQGGKEIFRHDWGWGENWDNGSEKPPADQRTKPMNMVVDGSRLEVSSSIEEKEGAMNMDKPGGHQVRIDWDIDTMTITLKTNRGREITFERRTFTHKSRGNGGALKVLDVPAK